ncbi:MAG TPA: hypothetical protein VHW65_12810 [Gemmatimonadales bacterium]|nr:hypothetical protein [Gemmatimonadales bacterium]
MRSGLWLMLVACGMSLSGSCWAAKTKKTKTRLYHNASSDFCAEVPADWNGPAEVVTHPGGRFDAPDGDASITFALSPNQPRSAVLGQKGAGAQRATLDDYREAIPNTWRSDASVSHVKVSEEEAATLNGAPALHIELAYKRSHGARRYEIVFALLNDEEYAVEYDATKRSAKKHENDFREAVSSFEFHCPAGGQ